MKSRQSNKSVENEKHINHIPADMVEEFKDHKYKGVIPRLEITGYFLQKKYAKGLEVLRSLRDKKI